MNMVHFNEWIRTLEKTIDMLQISHATGKAIEPDAAFDDLFRRALNTKRERSTIFLIGNGASASIASHVATDLAKNGHLRTMVLNDPSLLTAVGNDIGFSEVFAEPLRRLGDEKDLLVAISSSGRSPNILNAINTGRTIGMAVITFSAMHPDNPLRQLGDLNFYVPAKTYGHAESSHATLLHYWIDLHVNQLNKIAEERLHLVAMKKGALS